MSFGEAIKYCLRNMFVFSGRARRSEFWWYYLFLQIISLVVATIFMILIFGSMAPLLASTDAYGNVDEGAIVAWFAGMAVAYGFLILFSIALTVSMLGASARRLHDTGQSGHWLWLNLAGLGIVPLIMCIMEGQPHANQWGEDPKAQERAQMAQYYAGHPNFATPPTYATPAPTAAPPPPAASGDPYVTPPSA
jgi:uncharacterized membrane protein YhaH (DUF805 family)